MTYAVDRQVNSCTIRAVYSKNGTCTVTETWNIKIDEGDTGGVSRSIDIDSADLDKPSDVTNVTAYVGAVDMTGEITTSIKNGVFTCVWQGPFSPGVYEFTLCYTLVGSVKLVDDNAHCSLLIHSSTNKSQSQNVKVEICLPKKISRDDLNITEKGSFAFQSSDSGGVFSCDNCVGQMKFTFDVPKTLFDEKTLPTVSVDTKTRNIALASLCLVLTAIVGLLILYVLNYEKLVRIKYKKKVRRVSVKNHGKEGLNRFFDSTSPAELLKAVQPERKSDADLFIVTLCDLSYRGFLYVDETGFYAQKPTQNPYTRKISSFERDALKFICTYKPKNDRNGVEFKKFVDSFNIKVPSIGMFDLFSKKKSDKLLTMFEISSYSTMLRFVYPGKIADSMTKNYQYDMLDLVCAVINEKKIYPKKILFYRPSVKYKNDFFLLRNLYGRGKKAIDMQMEKAKQKPKKESENNK